MNKTEKKLVKAIEAGNYDEAVNALNEFTALNSTSDEQSNDYFEQLEAMGNDVAEEVIEDEEIIEEILEEEVVEEVVEVEAVAPRVEKRGAKAKSKSRKELESAFNNAIEVALAYKAENRRGVEAKFALRLSKSLGLIKKRLFR